MKRKKAKKIIQVRKNNWKRLLVREIGRVVERSSSRTMAKQLFMTALVTARRILPMREVLARPWIGVCVPLALSLMRCHVATSIWTDFILTDGEREGKKMARLKGRRST